MILVILIISHECIIAVVLVKSATSSVWGCYSINPPLVKLFFSCHEVPDSS